MGLPGQRESGAGSGRIVGYDLARASALFGMILVNFKLVMGASENGSATLVRWMGLLEGRAAAVFVVLAGIGISLLASKARRSGSVEALVLVRQRLRRRALVLFVIGLAYTPIWPADILHFYGGYLVLASLALQRSTRQLAGASVLLLVGFAALFFPLGYEREWDWSTLEYEGFWTPLGLVKNFLFNGFHPVIPWLAFLLIGMVIGRLDMSQPSVRGRVFAIGLGIAVLAEGASVILIEGLSSGLSAADQEVLVALFGTRPMPPMPLYMLAAAATASAFIVLCVEVGIRCNDRAWIQPLVATGQLSLTLYVAHVILGMGALEVMGRLDGQTLSFSILCSVLFFLGSMVFAHLWLLRFQRGPLEILLRALSEKGKK